MNSTPNWKQKHETGHFRSRKAKGAILIFTAISLIALMGFAALAIDLGYLYVVRAKLQNAADASALAGSIELYKNPSNAAYVAQTIAALNDPGHGTILAASDIQTGAWDSASQSLDATSGTPTAMKVTVRRSQSNSNAVPLIFGPIVGIDTADVSATAVAEYVYPPLNYGVAGVSTVTMSGNTTIDSYNSSQGAYSDSTKSSNGNVASGGSLSLSGNVIVDGEAHPGPGYTISMSGGSTVTGSYPNEGAAATAPLGQAPSFSSVSAPSSYDNNGLGSSLSLAGQTSLTLSPGTYYFSNVDISGQASLNISGDTTIYISGSINVAGNGFINETSNPNNLNILLTSSAKSANFSGNGSFYGTLYAPNTPVSISGNASYYGGFVGQSVSVSGNAAIHRDTNLVLKFTAPTYQLVQ